MTESQIKQKFKETYPDLMRGDEPLSPYFDIWEYGIELATNELTEAKDILTKILQRMPSFEAKSIEDLSLLNALSQAEQFLKGVNHE